MLTSAVVHLTFTVQSPTGTAVTGLTAGAFTLRGYLDGVEVSPSAVFSEVGSGTYDYAITTEATAGSLLYHVEAVTPASHFLNINAREYLTEEFDLSKLYARIIVPKVTLGATSTPTADTDITIDANRYAEIVVTIEDQVGDPIDLSGYTNLTFTVRDDTHTTVNYSLTTGITADASGVLTVPVPEDASFHSAIDAVITAGNDSTTLWYDVKGDKGGDATKTTNIMRGRLNLRRYEGSA